MANEPLVILRSSRDNIDYLELIIAETGKTERLYKIRIERLMIWQNTITFHLAKTLKKLLQK